jgi:hypothetical protein
MAVAGRPRETLAKAEAADEAVAFFVVGELQTHAIGIVLAASEAVVPLHADVTSVMTAATGFGRHTGRL